MRLRRYLSSVEVSFSGNLILVVGKMAKLLGLIMVFAIKIAKVKIKITETRVLLRELKEITSFMALEVAKKNTRMGCSLF